MTALLTWQGTFLCRHRTTGGLIQRPVDSPLDDADLVDIGIPAELLQVTFANHLRNDTGLSLQLTEGALAGWAITRAADGRSINLEREGQYLSAIYRGEGINGAAHAKDWEAFLPLSPADVEALRALPANNWVVRSTGAPVASKDVRFSAFSGLNLGSLKVDLRWQLPFDLSAWPNRLTLLREGWRIEQICRFRPLVYFAAFGNEATMRQFALSVRSLVTFGGYDGDIAVLTDHTAEEIAALLPAFDRPRVSVLQCDARDRMAFMAARYTIADWPDAWQYQPLLYADTDTIFDADIGPILRAIACSDRISAPVEAMSPLRTSASVGAGLLQLDGCDPRSMYGFNSGTIGIPNLFEHAHTLRLIGRVIANNAALNGRDSLGYADQEVANYVSYKIGHFDTVLLSPFVRVGWDNSVPRDNRRGILHFWAVAGSEERADVMTAYLQALEADT
jgi:hypothetical protein